MPHRALEQVDPEGAIGGTQLALVAQGEPKARPATPPLATMRLKIGKRELQKCTFNRKEALFTHPVNRPAGRLSPAARVLSTAQEPLPPAPRVLGMMHDRSSGDAGET
jgi:hypothetical protein